MHRLLMRILKNLCFKLPRYQCTVTNLLKVLAAPNTAPNKGVRMKL